MNQREQKQKSVDAIIKALSPILIQRKEQGNSVFDTASIIMENKNMRD